MDDSYFTRLTRADSNIFATQVGLLVEISVLSEMHALHLNIACERVHNSCPTVMLIYRLSLFQLMIMFSDECWGDV